MNAKTALVTGATTGIGKETARALARQGFRVLVHGRTEAKARAAAHEISETTGNRFVDPLHADLRSLQAVFALAADVQGRTSRLDVLVNNAGVMRPERRLTSDGYEETFAVNHLAHFALTTALLGLLKRSAPSRVVVVSSLMHVFGRIELEDLAAPSRYSGRQAYCNSKLANVLFAYELARRLNGTGVTANSLHPGSVVTEIGRDAGSLDRLFAKVARPFLLSAVEGADTSVYLASSSDVEGVTGAYFVRRTARKSSALSNNLGLSKALWSESERLCAPLASSNVPFAA